LRLCKQRRTRTGSPKPPKLPKRSAEEAADRDKPKRAPGHHMLQEHNSKVFMSFDYGDFVFSLRGTTDTSDMATKMLRLTPDAQNQGTLSDAQIKMLQDTPP